MIKQWSIDHDWLTNQKSKLVTNQREAVKVIKNKKLTFFNENRESKISGLDWRIVNLANQQEILRLQVSMHNPHKMTGMHHIHNLPTNRSRLTFRITPFSYDPIEKLATRTQLHYQMHILVIFISTFELNNIRLPR